MSILVTGMVQKFSLTYILPVLIEFTHNLCDSFLGPCLFERLSHQRVGGGAERPGGAAPGPRPKGVTPVALDLDLAVRGRT